ncbi:hypothetical protein [Pseudomonas sp. SED1]|uniref:hypothetical protein n=1 Tax=Pseudomonas sp. SED1 TaxID=3056845 RepID=UPI00296FB22B|nr:hypothetical protein [Pseudomonas sp. SED1]MDY0834178.1 hypothetical protein [Pseudomonas sp. SED1]
MNKMCGSVILVGLAISGCATKTPEKSIVSVSPAVVQPAPPKVAPPTPVQPKVRYEAVSANVSANAPALVSTDKAEAESEAVSTRQRVEQCRKELDVLKVYNKASYDKYEAEYQIISNKTSKYMQIKDSISADINDMVMPGYQFQIREFCFRVKTRLSELVLRQAK